MNNSPKLFFAKVHAVSENVIVFIRPKVSADPVGRPNYRGRSFEEGQKMIGASDVL